MQNEDLSKFLTNSKNSCSYTDCYPGLEESDDPELDNLAHSYDILMDVPDKTFYRQRSNTAQNLEKIKLARVRAAKIRNVKLDDRNVLKNDEKLATFFIKKHVFELQQRSSLLSQKLLLCPKQSSYNKFIEYARFDGTAQTAIQTRTIKIFLTMLPEKQRNYPMTVCVIATAKILDFIGLICYKCSLAHPDVQLKSNVKVYGLYITEADGEVDLDFPALDLREPCSKFRFNHLALMEQRQHFGQNSRESGPDEIRTLSMTSEVELMRNQALVSEENSRLNLQQQQTKDLAIMMDHTTMMDAPLYKSYRVQMFVVSSLYKIEIQLGLSGEKLELDPVQQKNTKLWSKQKAISHNMSSVAFCEIIEQKPTRAIFRIIYSPDKLSLDSKGKPHHALPSNEFPIDRHSSSVLTSTTIQFNGGSSGSSNFKQYTFETSLKTAQEIVDKVRNILEVRSSSTRKEYLSYRDKRSRRKAIRPKTSS